MVFLVGGFKHFLFHFIYGIILPSDFHIFQRGRYTTNQYLRGLASKLVDDQMLKNTKQSAISSVGPMVTSSPKHAESPPRILQGHKLCSRSCLTWTCLHHRVIWCIDNIYIIIYICIYKVVSTNCTFHPPNQWLVSAT